MILGSGLLARAFAPLADEDSILVFASGVSNSTTATTADLSREADLLTLQAGTRAQLVYFSTCSLYDPSLAGSTYVRHKRHMEAMVRDLFPDHLILRLPNIVGRTPNPHTLCNYLRDRIVNGEPVRMHLNACRHLMGVDQVAAACIPLLLTGKFHNTAINACFDHPVPVPEIVRTMEAILGRTARVVPVDAGTCYRVPNADFKRFWQEQNTEPWPEDGHWATVLREVYGPAAPGPRAGN